MMVDKEVKSMKDSHNALWPNVLEEKPVSRRSDEAGSQPAIGIQGDNIRKGADVE